MIIKTFGERLKRIRTLMGLTQKELSQKAGFSATNSSADVRIRQYESNRMLPKVDALKRLAQALDVDASALFTAEIQSKEELLHILFELEDEYNLKTEKDGSDFILRFSNLAVQDRQLQIYFDNWHREQLKYYGNLVNKRNYDLWRSKFPSVSEVDITEVDKQAIKEQIAAMQAQANELNDKIDFLSKQADT